MYCFEIKTLDSFGFFNYYYVTTSKPLRSTRDVLTNRIPDKCRMVIIDSEESVIDVRFLSPFAYIYRKWFRHPPFGGIKRNWKKDWAVM